MKKILILLFYYDRPNFVRIALNSVLEHQYSNWEIAFIDDSSKIPGKPIVEEMLNGHLDKIKFYNTNDSVENKLSRGQEHGSIFGKYAQIAVEESDADYVMMLCDDDALYPGYFENLNKYFAEHVDENYVYSHIHTYNPILTPLDTNPRF